MNRILKQQKIRNWGYKEINGNNGRLFQKMVQDSGQTAEVKYEIISEKIEGDNAVVMYKEEGKEGEIPLNLMRVDGKWKVNMTKESLNGAEGSDKMDVGATNTDSLAAGMNDATK